MAEFSVNAKVSGILQHTDYLDQWQQHRDVRYARPLVPVSLLAHTSLLGVGAGRFL